MSKIEIGISEVWGQVYLLPFVKITHDKLINGRYEFIVGWFKWEVIIML